MSTLFIFNDSPHFHEKSWHGLRVAAGLAANGEAVKLFLFVDGVRLAKTPADATFETSELLEKLYQNAADISACKSCLAERNINGDTLREGIKPGTLDDVVRWTGEAAKVLVY